jgi:hypothetical protein
MVREKGLQDLGDGPEVAPVHTFQQMGGKNSKHICYVQGVAVKI